LLSLVLAFSALQEAPANPGEAAGRVFLQCLETRISTLPVSVEPEAGAELIMQQCAEDRVLLDRFVDDQIAKTPKEDQARNRARYQATLAGEAQQWIADQITASRKGKAR
jgi:hypothetical protein